VEEQSPPPPAGLPLACTLGPDDGRARRARWRQLAETAGPVARRRGAVLEVHYSPGPGVAPELRALAAAEQECCSFVTWTVGDDDGCPVLRVVADPSRSEDVDPIAMLFRAEP
jgi:hypothetical protein